MQLKQHKFGQESFEFILSQSCHDTSAKIASKQSALEKKSPPPILTINNQKPTNLPLKCISERTSNAIKCISVTI